MLFLGIDVGGTNVRAAVADERGEVLSFREDKTPHDAVEPLVSKIVGIAKSMQQDLGEPIEAAGVGFPGLIDFRRGVVCYSPNLPAISGIALAGMLSDRLGMKAHLGNDANLAAMGEGWLGAGTKLDHFALITLGTGVGSGLIIDGRPFWGGTGCAAELGHLKVDPDGEQCPCGDRGCLEAYSSATGLRARALRARSQGEESSMWALIGDDDKALNPRLVDQAALSGDALAQRLLCEAGTFLGIAIAALADLVGIQSAIVGGRMADMRFDIIKTAQKEANRRSLCARKYEVRVVKSVLGDRAGCLGAVRYAMDSLNG